MADLAEKHLTKGSITGGGVSAANEGYTSRDNPQYRRDMAGNHHSSSEAGDRPLMNDWTREPRQSDDVSRYLANRVSMGDAARLPSSGPATVFKPLRGTVSSTLENVPEEDRALVEAAGPALKSGVAEIVVGQDGRLLVKSLPPVERRLKRTK